MNKYLLLDANVVSAYYLPQSSTVKIHKRITDLLNCNKVKGRQKRPFVFFVPNFCIAEVFNIFRKYRYGKWNSKVKNNGAITKRFFNKIYKRFQSDIHNGRLFYHFELSRYHLLNTAFISPIDHHYAYGKSTYKQRPMSTFDLLIIAMGIELVRLHGKNEVKIITDDNRIFNIIERAKKIKTQTAKDIGLYEAGNLVGRKFSRSIYPDIIHIGKIKEKEFQELLTFD